MEGASSATLTCPVCACCRKEWGGVRHSWARRTREAFASAEVEVRQLRERRGYGERVERGAVDEREAHQGTERGHAHLLQPCRTADRDLGQRGAPRELQRAREGFRREGFRRRWEGCRHVPARRRGCEG
eukprot:6483347-Prymnesium_polylepis.1